jgi:hypothetical protein
LPFIHAGYCRECTRRAVSSVASLHGNGDAANSSCTRGGSDTISHYYCSHYTCSTVGSRYSQLCACHYSIRLHARFLSPRSLFTRSFQCIPSFLHRSFLLRRSFPFSRVCPSQERLSSGCAAALSTRPHDAQLLNNSSESYVDKLKSPSSGRSASRGVQ